MAGKFLQRFEFEKNRVFGDGFWGGTLIFGVKMRAGGLSCSNWAE